MEASKQPSPLATEILGRALVDDDFRALLYDNPDDALAEYKDLTDEDNWLLRGIPREALEANAKTFREGSVVGATVAIGVGGHFGADDETKTE